MVDGSATQVQHAHGTGIAVHRLEAGHNRTASAERALGMSRPRAWARFHDAEQVWVGRSSQVWEPDLSIPPAPASRSAARRSRTTAWRPPSVIYTASGPRCSGDRLSRAWHHMWCE